MTIIEPVDPRVFRLEDELNRLAGTLVGGMPTLGKATAALWWLGHRELAWASHNMLTPNVATGGKALASTDGFYPLDGQVVEVVEGGLLGNQCVRVTADATRARSMPGEHKILEAALGLGDPQPVEPWHIYTASIYTQMEPGAITPSRVNWMYLTWLDEAGRVIGETQGDFHVSKEEWNLTWVTAPAPENATHARVWIEWQQADGESFRLDKAIFYNGHDPQAWAFPGAGGFDLDAGLRAHLNMRAGIFDPAKFVTVEQACIRIAQTQDGTPAGFALSLIPTPNPNVVPH